ncbi:MAG: DUF3164 family protein [Flavobacteriales bacterium]
MELIQRSRDKMWRDETGQAIPYNRTTPLERLNERITAKIHREAVALNKKLSSFKNETARLCNEAYMAYMKAQGIEVADRKGNYTLHSFNRGIKIEVSVSARIEFDDLGIAAAKVKFDQFLSKNVESKDAFVKEMILQAFETSRGRLDTKRITNLMRYRSKVKDPLFREAVDLLEGAIRRPDSRVYFRVWQRQEGGGYKAIDLNFSSII